MVRCALTFIFCFIAGYVSAQDERGPTQSELTQPAPDLRADIQELNELLSLLDSMAGFQQADAFANQGESSGLGAVPASGGDDWMLEFLTMLDDQSHEQREQAQSELRSALLSLRSAGLESDGALKETLSAAASNISVLLELADQPVSASNVSTRYAIAEAQRAMGLFHCDQANRNADGTLADSLSVVKNRLEHLVMGSRFMMSAAATANYRIPESTKRTIASSVAMSKLFSPREVSLSQIRTRARDMIRSLNELGQAIKRMR